MKDITGYTTQLPSELYCYHSMRALCMERLELLDPNPDHLKEKLIGKLSSPIARHNSNDDLLYFENRVMDQDTISIRGNLTEIKQRFPNLQGHQQKKAYHLQLKSKSPTQLSSSYLETFQCYDVGRAENPLETLVSVYGC